MTISEIKQKHEAQYGDYGCCTSRLTYAEVERLVKSHGELLDACQKSKVIIESTDTAYKDKIRQSAIEALTAINAAITGAE